MHLLTDGIHYFATPTPDAITAELETWTQAPYTGPGHWQPLDLDAILTLSLDDEAPDTIVIERPARSLLHPDAPYLHITAPVADWLDWLDGPGLLHKTPPSDL